MDRHSEKATSVAVQSEDTDTFDYKGHQRFIVKRAVSIAHRLVQKAIEVASWAWETLSGTIAAAKEAVFAKLKNVIEASPCLAAVLSQMAPIIQITMAVKALQSFEMILEDPPAFLAATLILILVAGIPLIDTVVWLIGTASDALEEKLPALHKAAAPS